MPAKAVRNSYRPTSFIPTQIFQKFPASLKAKLLGVFLPSINPLEEWELASYADKRLKTSQLFAGSFLGPPLVLGQGRQALSMSDEAGRDRCTAFWNTFSVKYTTEEEEDTNGGEFAVRQVMADECV